LSDIEIFYMPEEYIASLPEADRHDWEIGWYWWYCQPGCLPDSEPFGPFDSREDAEKDYNENSDEYDIGGQLPHPEGRGLWSGYAGFPAMR